MTSLNLMNEIHFKEVITGLELVDLTGDGQDNLVVSTMSGDFRIYDFVNGDSIELKELTRASDLPPVASFGLGDVTGNGIQDFVVGGLDNILRVLIFMDGELSVKASTPVGTLPTSLIVTNVMDDDSAEVIVATNDRAIRCYGWFDVALDKLAHKVVNQPVFTMQPLRSKGSPYTRFVFGDELGNLYVYQYADDRLHELERLNVSGEVNLVATGNVTGDRHDDIVSISGGNNLALFDAGQKPPALLAKIRAPSAITSVRVGKMLEDCRSDGQILVSLGNSKMSILSFEGRELFEEASLKTASKSVESLIAFGDIDGDKDLEIVQATGNHIYMVSIDED
ncbi:MAG: hypothetical protein ACTSUO_08650 [Candidatus Thorarchaeota archaeon]